MAREGSILRVGVAGLGTVSRQILAGFTEAPGVALAGAADLRAEARAAFTRNHALPAFDSVEAMCRSDAIDAVWIATPNAFHGAHSILAAEHGKHVICEKPIALSLAECDRMIAAADAAGVQLLQGHSKIFDSPIQAMRRIIASGRLGTVIQINSMMYNDWLQRPRIESEIDAASGGGVVFHQGPHMIDIVRFLAGGVVRSLRANCGRWDPHFKTEGNFSAIMDFADGAIVSLAFNGYGYFDVSELTWGIGVYGAERREVAPAPRRTRTVSEAEKYAGPLWSPATKPDVKKRMPFFGLTIVSCERGVIRQSPDGLYVYDENGCAEIAVSRNIERAAELIELRDALAENRRVFPDGRWEAGTLETCLAILESSRKGSEIGLTRQSPCPTILRS